jgi:hypothetical protein
MSAERRRRAASIAAMTTIAEKKSEFGFDAS